MAQNRYFLGKLAHASFYSTAMSQTQVQALYQSYLDHFLATPALFGEGTPPPKPASDGARAVALGSLAKALAAGLAALLL